jgi:hypothetical protein
VKSEISEPSVLVAVAIASLILKNQPKPHELTVVTVRIEVSPDQSERKLIWVRG